MMIKNTIKPEKRQKILDYGCGKGDIALKFKNDGYDITTCDISEKFVDGAKKIGLASHICSEIINSGDKFDKVYMNNGFFYIHPKKYKSFLSGLYNLIKDNGDLYLLTVATYDKRSYYLNRISKFITRIFPVYQVHIGGFFVKDKKLIKCAKQAGFKTIERIEENSDARTNFLLKK
jgi:2-polyprenyl-3-methyl-5-hydroxy-6-metoxy-1,4-benzoquinol methylase